MGKEQGSLVARLLPSTCNLVARVRRGSLVQVVSGEGRGGAWYAV